MSESALRHIEHFTNTIGPRGSATPKEVEALDYCAATLEGLGYEARRESFMAPTSGWHPYALAQGLMLLAVAVFVLMGQGADAGAGGLAATALGLLVLVSVWLQMAHRSNPLEWFLATAPSQNVWAAAAPSGDERERVVVVGHVDTHRTALAMQSPGLWQFFRVLTPVVGLANLALVIVFIWGAASMDPLPRQIALVLAIFDLIGLVFTLQPDFTPYVKGANDNASGAGAVLALAERLKAEPLAHTTVYLLNTGSEEVGGQGVVDWIKRHAGQEADDADFLVLDSIAGRGAGVNYVVAEQLLLPVPANDGLVELAEKVAAANPALGAKPFHYRGLFSEMSLAAIHGQRALAVMNFSPRTGTPPHFHTARDNMNNVDPAVLERSEQFAWAILKEIDGEAEEGESEPATDRPEAQPAGQPADVAAAEPPAQAPAGEPPAETAG
jgi:hypothetical protein